MLPSLDHEEKEMAGRPKAEELPQVVDKFMNSGISINYVSDWGLKEAIRELIQNCVDGMVALLISEGGHKKDLNVLMHENNHLNGTYRTFTFTWPQKNKYLGKITYNPDSKQLVLENPGTINKFNLLLGGSGSSKQQNNPDIIGRFGEGMKLAALALLRPTKKPFKDHLSTHPRSLIIDTNKERWLFKLESDNNFDNEICLFYKITKLPEKKINRLEMKNKFTYTRINGISLNEWNNEYKNFIFFCKTNEVMEIKTSSPNIKHKGSILLHDTMKGRMFVKDLHIHDYGSYDYDAKDNAKTLKSFQKGDPAATYYGFNTNQIDLNRDRKSIPNLWHKYDRCSCVIADILNNHQINLNKYPDSVDELNDMWAIIYWSLRTSRHEIWYFHNYVKHHSATADRIWSDWLKDSTYFGAGNKNNIRKLQPLYSGHGHQIERFFREKKLEPSFYEYIIVADRLYHTLCKSTYYQHWDKRFDALIANCKDYVLNENENTIQQRLVERIKKVKNNFNVANICFKDVPLTKSTSFAKNGKLYLSKDLLLNERELLSKSLMLLQVSTIEILGSFGVV